MEGKMKIGAWIHDRNLSLETQIEAAARSGLELFRTYDYDNARRAAPAIKLAGMELVGGMHIDAGELLRDWRSQVHLAELEDYIRLGVTLNAICVGNELREGGDEPEKKRFTARLSFGLANVLQIYRGWLDDHGIDVPLTYAMESIVCDAEGRFFEWLWPLVDACDVVGMNLYPMGESAWFTPGAFDESRRFLREGRTRHDRMNRFEYQLRTVLGQLEQCGKGLLLTETGFPSAVRFRLEAGDEGVPAGRSLVVPEHDREAFAEAMTEFAKRISQVNHEYDGRIRGLVFYEWRDNLYHGKIWNGENSPIHTAFGLCSRDGQRKLDISQLVRQLKG
jgi:hypothetical protein